jgi:hypothetical protein
LTCLLYEIFHLIQILLHLLIPFNKNFPFSWLCLVGIFLSFLPLLFL